MKSLPWILILLAHFSGVARTLCRSGVEEAFAARDVPVWSERILDLLPLGQEDEYLTVVRHGSASGVDLLHVGAMGEETVASLPDLFPTSTRPYLVRQGDSWWMSFEGREGREAKVLFVDGAGAPVEIPLSPWTLLWLPVPGAEPEGIAVSGGEHQLRFDEASPAGVRGLGSFAWTSDHGGNLRREAWAATALPGGRIAVAEVETSGTAALTLYILGGERPTRTEIACATKSLSSIAMAADETGALAIVGVSPDGDIVAHLLNWDQPHSGSGRVLPSEHAPAARSPISGPWVVATPRGFLTAWIDEKGGIHATMLQQDLRSPPEIIDVTEGAETFWVLQQMIHLDGELATFIWNDRNGRPMQRTLPANLDAWSRFSRGLRNLCANVEGDSDRKM